MDETKVSTGTIAAYFENNKDARHAVDALQEAGFASAHLGIAHREDTLATDDDLTADNSETRHGDNEPSTWEKIKAWFTGGDAEHPADRQDRDDLADREITATRDDNNFLNERYDDSSDLRESFTALDVPAERSHYFAHRLGRGSKGAVVTVQAGNRVTEAEEILCRFDADLGEESAAYEYEEVDEEQTSGQPRYQLLGAVLRVHTERGSRGEFQAGRTRTEEAQIKETPGTEPLGNDIPARREDILLNPDADIRANNTRSTVRDAGARTADQYTPSTTTQGERAAYDEATAQGTVVANRKGVEAVRNVSGDTEDELTPEERERRQRSA